MNDRPTASTINDQQLDELHDALDGAYRERAHLVALLAALHPAHIGYTDPTAIDWLVVTIETPTGQMSWHIAERDRDLFEHVQLVPAEHNVWDGHTTEQKYARMRRLTANPGRADEPTGPEVLALAGLTEEEAAAVATLPPGTLLTRRVVDEVVRTAVGGGCDGSHRFEHHEVVHCCSPAAVETEPNNAPWTPPPPGDRREQLPDHLLALIDIPLYTSTACETAELLAAATGRHPEHAEELWQWEARQRQRCRINNKYTGVDCTHTTPGPKTEPNVTREN